MRRPSIGHAQKQQRRAHPKNTEIDEAQQLGEILRHYAKKRSAQVAILFESQSAVWETRIGELFDQIQQWLEPVGLAKAVRA